MKYVSTKSKKNIGYQPYKFHECLCVESRSN